MDTSKTKLNQLVNLTVSGLGYEFVGLEHLSQGKHSILRIYIDDTDGITIDDCEKVSRQLSAVLDVEDPIRGEYALEVSSPGLERPLFTEAHYQRFIGNCAKVELVKAVMERKRLKGLIKQVEDHTVIIDSEGEQFEVAFSNIKKGHLVFE